MSRIEAGRHPVGDETPFEVQGLSIVCWSCAALRLEELRLMSVIAEIALHRIEDFKPVELSNFLWAYAKLNMGTPHL